MKAATTLAASSPAVTKWPLSLLAKAAAGDRSEDQERPEDEPPAEPWLVRLEVEQRRTSRRGS